MADIIKTWPANMDSKVVAELFSKDNPPFCEFYFTLGRGRPQQSIERLSWLALLQLRRIQPNL